MSVAARSLGGAVLRNAARVTAAPAAASGRRVLSTLAVAATAARHGAVRSQRGADARVCRGVQTLTFGSEKEQVTSRSDFPKERIHKLFAGETFAMLGYGTQGRGQALNLRDNGMNVIIGLRPGKSWDLAVQDGWQPGKSLFPIGEACAKANTIMYLLSDAAQKSEWPTVKPHVTKGKTLFFSHGFSIVYADQTGVVPPKDVDVVMVAPKGSGFTVRRLFTEGRGINSSVAVHQDASGKAEERAYALGVALGSGYLYPTTFSKEVHSDLVGERGILMGAIQGLFLAQYEVLRANGHSASEAFNETVEEATQSLYPLIGERGMDWMYANCSTTAQRGALDWYPRFHKAAKPVFEQLYAAVKDGSETRRTIEANGKPDYKTSLEKELKELREHEMWKAGETVRGLRPERQTAAKK